MSTSPRATRPPCAAASCVCTAANAVPVVERIFAPKTCAGCAPSPRTFTLAVAGLAACSTVGDIGRALTLNGGSSAPVTSALQ